MRHQRSQQPVDLQGELLLHYMRWIASFQPVKEHNAERCVSSLHCCDALAHWVHCSLNYGWSVDQFCRLLCLPLCLSGVWPLQSLGVYQMHWRRCSLPWSLLELTFNMSGPVGTQGLPLCSSSSEKCDSLHLFCTCKRLPYLEVHCGM